MARPRYPSDDKRLKRPSGVTIGFSIRNPDPLNPGHAEVFEDPEKRGIWTGLLVVAGHSFAGRSDDRVTLSGGDLSWVTGRTHRGPALGALRVVCGCMGYAVEDRGRSVVVHVRNLSQNQGWTTRDSAESAAESPRLRPPPSPSPIPSSDSSSEESSEGSGTPRKRGARAPRKPRTKRGPSSGTDPLGPMLDGRPWAPCGPRPSKPWRIVVAPAWSAAYRRRRGSTYAMATKDAVLLAQLAKTHGRVRLVAMMARFLASTDDLLAQRRGHDVVAFQQTAQRWREAVAQDHRRRARERKGKREDAVERRKAENPNYYEDLAREMRTSGIFVDS